MHGIDWSTAGHMIPWIAIIGGVLLVLLAITMWLDYLSWKKKGEKDGKDESNS